MELVSNMVCQYQDGTGKRIRIVHIMGEWVFYINLEDKKSLPKKIAINVMQNAYEDEHLIEIKDPYAFGIEEEALSEQQIQERNDRYKIVSKIWGDTGAEFLKNGKKSKKIEEVANEHGISKDTAKRVLCRYLVRGMHKNTLINDYKNCGAAGQDKADTPEKKGRKPRNLVDEEKLVGTNIDTTIKNIILDVYKSQYLTKKQKTYKKCYEYMLNHYFSNKYIVGGEENYDLWEGDRIPSYQQFRYWCNKFRDPKNEFIKRQGDKKYQLTKREQSDSPDNYVFGPGSKYEVDATMADIYLLSESMNTQTIGRPIIYVLIDVFSRLIVGAYIGIEGPSWIAAAMALDNIVEDKVEFCKHYDINTTAEEWPNSYLPEEIVADKGEFEGYNVESMIKNFNITITNVTTGRGDLKSIVERKFRTLNDEIKQIAPGAVIKRVRDRGERPYHLDAKLTLTDFRRMILLLIIEHNRSLINKYERDPEMLKDCVQAKPNELWSWGMKYRRTAMVKRDRNMVRLNILPSDKATITKQGIKFKTRLFYTCSKAVEEQWFFAKLGEKVNVAYDPRNMNQIYIKYLDNSGYEVAALTKRCNKYKDLSLDEIEYMAFLDRMQKKQIEYEQIQQKTEIDYELEKIIRKAEQRYIESNTSDRQQTLSIKENRRNEQIENRKDESFDLSNEVPDTNAKVVDFKTGQEVYEEHKPASKLDMLRRVRDGMKDGET